MRYDYRCMKCSTALADFVFETSHGMNENPKVKCPKCNKTNTEVTFVSDITFYTRGNGWLDKKGRQRDMNLYKLQNDDPYASMRQPGEKEEKAAELRKGGRHDPKAKKFFVNKATNKKGR